MASVYGVPQQQMFSSFHPQTAAGILGVGDRSPQHILQPQNHTQSQSRPLYAGGSLPLPLSGPLPILPHSFPPLPSVLQAVSPLQEGIEADVLPESAFTSVAWLRQHGMYMYRWAGDAAEWTEYAMHLPPSVTPFFTADRTSPSSVSVLSDLQASGCKMWVDKETLMGREATFLVFLRGAAGQPSNACMNTALDLLSIKMRQLLPQIASQSHLYGSIGSNRVNTPPLLSGLTSTLKQPLSAWSTGASFVGVSTGTGGDISGLGMGLAVDEEDHSIISDEYYDPEDLARSLSLLGEGVDGGDTDWCTVPPKRNISLPSTRRPEPLRLNSSDGQGGYVQRWLEIPRDSVGLVIGQGGKKIKDLCTLSGAKIQFRVNKTAEREGRPGLLELQGGVENVDQGLQLVWDLLHLLGKEYQEVPVQRLK